MKRFLLPAFLLLLPVSAVSLHADARHAVRAASHRDDDAHPGFALAFRLRDFAGSDAKLVFSRTLDSDDWGEYIPPEPDDPDDPDTRGTIYLSEETVAALDAATRGAVTPDDIEAGLVTVLHEASHASGPYRLSDPPNDDALQIEETRAEDRAQMLLRDWLKLNPVDVVE